MSSFLKWNNFLTFEAGNCVRLFEYMNDATRFIIPPFLKGGLLHLKFGGIDQRRR